MNNPTPKRQSRADEPSSDELDEDDLVIASVPEYGRAPDRWPQLVDWFNELGIHALNDHRRTWWNSLHPGIVAAVFGVFAVLLGIAMFTGTGVAVLLWTVIALAALLFANESNRRHRR